MKKNLLLAGLCLASLAATAQETYDNAQLMSEDLNGTARYTSMGGAMEALGADISTMGTNPAGIGLFRRSWFGVSAGATTQQGDKRGTFGKSGKANADFNQIGFIYCNRVGANSSFNLGFNYHKSNNFNHVLSAINSLDNSSMNKGTYIGYATFGGDKESLENMSGPGNLIYNHVNGRMEKGSTTYRTASMYGAQTEAEGYISDFDFNFSGNINDQIYLGITIGLKDVHYSSESYYGEDLLDINNNDGGYLSLLDSRNITGTGFNVKFGGIFRPSEESPFRVGVYVHTPTWYELRCSQVMYGASWLAGVDSEPRPTEPDYPNEFHANTTPYTYDYKITTPWKFGISLGHTFGKFVAIGATYEYADYGITTNRVKTGTYYNEWGDYDDTYARDYEMDKNTKEVLKGVSLLKLGVEVKPTQGVALRLGYNYQSAMYDKNGTKGLYNNGGNSQKIIDSYYSDGAFTSTYDYINWKATQRLTAGVGINLGKTATLDISYQYATQKGDYHPFATTSIEYKNSNGNTVKEVNKGTVSEVKNNRHLINCTLGFRF